MFQYNSLIFSIKEGIKEKQGQIHRLQSLEQIYVQNYLEFSASSTYIKDLVMCKTMVPTAITLLSKIFHFSECCCIFTPNILLALMLKSVGHHLV